MPETFSPNSHRFSGKSSESVNIPCPGLAELRDRKSTRKWRMMMEVVFIGAVREVTGSMHMVCSGPNRVLLDCGMFQGKRKESTEKNRVLPFDPKIITNVVLSHGHIDHSGRIPMLIRSERFFGRIYCTRATEDVSSYLLMDAAYIQESDADYLNYKTLRTALNRIQSDSGLSKGEKKENDKLKKKLKREGHRLNTDIINKMISKYRLEKVEPIYTVADAEKSLGYFEGIPYRYPVTIGKGASLTFYEAGHILGSAFSILRINENGHEFKIGYSGDIGRFDKPIIRDPNRDFEEPDRDLDLLILESTYGNRVHEPVGALKPAFAEMINETVERGGSIIIPSFAFGRTQELLYVLHELYNEGVVPRLPVYVDSPLATNLTTVFGEHPEIYDRETHETFLQQKKNPFVFKEIRYIGSVEESMALNREEKPHIVIAASGMCEAGRVLHHLRYKIHNERHTILIVGYMAQNTLGRRILEQGTEYERSGRNGSPPILRFLNKEYPLRARVRKLGGFSAHGDKNDMLRFLKESNLNVKRIALVHGEEDQALSFADFLSENGFSVFVPSPGEIAEVKKA
ncbi:MAG: MBL fold metallo-hydrolase [Desulfobacterales bacterium]